MSFPYQFLIWADIRSIDHLKVTFIAVCTTEFPTDPLSALFGFISSSLSAFDLFMYYEHEEVHNHDACLALVNFAEFFHWFCVKGVILTLWNAIYIYI